MKEDEKEKIKAEMSNHLRMLIKDTGFSYINIITILINGIFILVHKMGKERFSELAQELAKVNEVYAVVMAHAIKLAFDLCDSMEEKIRSIPEAKNIYDEDILKFMRGE